MPWFKWLVVGLCSVFDSEQGKRAGFSPGVSSLPIITFYQFSMFSLVLILLLSGGQEFETWNVKIQQCSFVFLKEWDRKYFNILVLKRAIECNSVKLSNLKQQ
jgi:hypothetical protein